MTNAELIKALRNCSDGMCSLCPYDDLELSTKGCEAKLMLAAADALEADEQKIAEQQKQIAQLYLLLNNRINEIAELEAQMPREGEWIYEDLDNFRKYKVTCPHCGAWYIGNYDAYDEPSDFNYCPHCGNICNPANLAWEKELSERERKEQTDCPNCGARMRGEHDED